jgi:hypothetical protein
MIDSPQAKQHEGPRQNVQQIIAARAAAREGKTAPKKTVPSGREFC